MSWQFSSVLQTFFVALSMICLRILARDKRTANASFVVNGVMYIALYVAMIAVLPWLGTPHSGVLGQYWWRFVLGGLLFAGTNVCTYKTMVYFDVAITNIASTINAVLTVAGAALLLGEMLSVRQALGGAVLLAAIIYGLLATHSVSKRLVRRTMYAGSFYALLAGVFFALAIVNEKSLLGQMSQASYMVYGVGGQCAISVLAALVLQRRKLHLLARPHVAGWSLLSGLLRGLGGACFIWAEVKSNNVGLVSVVVNFRLVVAIFLAAWLLRERQFLKQKLAAAAVSIGGMSLMFWK